MSCWNLAGNHSHLHTGPPGPRRCRNLLCGLADDLDALVESGVPGCRVLLIGGAASLRRYALSILGHPVVVREPSPYVADGAAGQAAWALRGADGPPTWETGHEAQ